MFGRRLSSPPPHIADLCGGCGDEFSSPGAYPPFDSVRPFRVVPLAAFIHVFRESTEQREASRAILIFFARHTDNYFGGHDLDAHQDLKRITDD